MSRPAVPASQARFWLGAAGVVAAAGAVAADSRAVGWVAVALLGLAFAGRMVAARRARTQGGAGDT